MTPTPAAIRPAGPDDIALLPALEAAADRAFENINRGPLPPPGELADLTHAHHLLVTGTPPIGFARLETIDGHAHLEQLSVHPTHARQGAGTALLLAACRWAADQGHPTITLCTFADVPWNAPFYARHGFTPIPDTELTPGLRALRLREQELGLDALGERTAMAKTLP